MILDNQQRVFRKETRMDRYYQKKNTAQTFPVSLVGINFQISDNVGFLIRSAACFGARRVIVIGSLPPAHEISSKSGVMNRMIEILQFSNPGQYLEFSRSEQAERIALELCEDSESVFDFRFNPQVNTHIIVGNESTGVPGEILIHSKKVFIPMPGVGFCLNTSQAANIGLYEYVRQTAT